MARASFVASTPYDAAHPSALAIYCSDGRFTESVEQLLHRLGHARLDTRTMPGGPGLFDVWVAGMTDSAAVATGSKFLIEGHRIQRVIVIAHEGCGYYRKHLGARPQAELRKKQEDDLRVAARALVGARPGLRVDGYYARVEGGRVTFDPVAT